MTPSKTSQCTIYRTTKNNLRSTSNCRTNRSPHSSRCGTVHMKMIARRHVSRSYEKKRRARTTYLNDIIVRSPASVDCIVPLFDVIRRTAILGGTRIQGEAFAVATVEKGVFRVEHIRRFARHDKRGEKQGRLNASGHEGHHVSTRSMREKPKR